MRRAAKRDDNEPLIVTALQSAGWTVLRVSDAGIMDLLAARNGILTPLEVKGPEGKLTPKQKETFTALATAGILVQVVRSPGEALDAVGAPWDGVAIGGVAKRKWLAENGAFLCEQCWLPENGQHAKDCPTRKALKVPPKVQSAHCAAKKAEALLPKPKVLAGIYESGADGRDVPRAAKKIEEAMPKKHGHTMIATPTSPMSEVAFSRPSRGAEGELQSIKQRGAKARTGDARAVINALRRENEK